MFHKSHLGLLLVFLYCSLHSQIVEVIDNKGTIKSIDNSKWAQSGTDIHNKNSGKVGIGNTSPTTTLEVSGKPTITTEADGIMIPKLSGDQLKAKNTQYTSAQTGTIVYVTSADTSPAGQTINVTDAGFYFYDGSAWQSGSASSATNNLWSILGNSGTLPATNFIGTTDAQDLVFRTNNTEKTRILSNGNAGIGTSNPTQKFEVAGSMYQNFENSAFVVDEGGKSRLGIVKKVGSNPFIAAGNNQPIIFSQLSSFSQTNIFGNIGSSFVERMRIDGNGNVGIGGGVPSNLLHLSGITNFPAGNLLRYIQISNFNTGNTTSDGTIIGINATGEMQINNREAQPIVFSTTNSEKMRIDASGKVGIGNTSPTTTLEVSGKPTITTEADGIMIPKLSGDQLKAKNTQYTSAQTGTILYVTSADTSPAGQTINVTDAGFYFYDGSEWQSGSASSATNNLWSILGNSGTLPATNFIGTTDAQDLVFRTNNLERLRLFNYALPNGVLGLGRSSLTGVNGGASTFSGPTLFFGTAGNISSNTGLDFIIDDDNDAVNTQFSFKANGDGNTGTVELMQINENGNVGIGIFPSTASAILHTNGTVRLQGLGTNTTNTNVLTTDINGNVTNKVLSNIVTGSSSNVATNALTLDAGATNAVLGSADATLTVNNTAPLWNANQLQGNDVSNVPPTTEGQLLTWDDTNSNWEPRTSVINNLAEIYIDTGSFPLTTNNTFQDIVFTSNGIVDIDFTTTTTSITVANAGRYEISYRATVFNTATNNNRSGAEFFLDIDGTEAPGTRSYTYNRSNDVGYNTVTTIKISDLNAGSVVKLKGRNYVTAAPLIVVNGSSLIVKRIK